MDLQTQTIMHYQGNDSFKAIGSLNSNTQVSIRISPLNIAKYLDTNEMKVKSKVAHDYVTDAINWFNSHQISDLGPIKLTNHVVKDITEAVGKNHYRTNCFDIKLEAETIHRSN
jgi:hypothetical protein